MLDTGTFHGLADEERLATARELDALCAPDATILPRMTREIVRTPIAPAHRPRRRLEERLLLSLPALTRWGISAALRLRPHTRLRREWIAWGLRAGWEATNRGDWPMSFLIFHPDYEMTFEDEMHLLPDLGRRHVGHSAVRAMLEEWQAAFAEFRFEPRESLDPGGNVVGATVEQVGRGTAGVEIRQLVWIIWRFDKGLVVRQQFFFEEEPALAALQAEPRPG